MRYKITHISVSVDETERQSRYTGFQLQMMNLLHVYKGKMRFKRFDHVAPEHTQAYMMTVPFLSGWGEYAVHL